MSHSHKCPKGCGNRCTCHNHFYRITFHADEPEGTDDAYLCVECETTLGWGVEILPEPAKEGN